MSWLSYFSPRTILRIFSPYNSDIRVMEESGKYKLLVEGSRQSGQYIADLWRYALSHLPIPRDMKMKNILVLGVAGGTIIHILKTKYIGASIVAVDIDPAMLAIGKKYFGLTALAPIRFVCADAKEFVKKEKSCRYDLIVVDLFHGAEIPSFVLSKSFTLHLRRLLRPGGLLLINYLRERYYRQKSEILARLLRKNYREVSDAERFNNRFFLARNNQQK